MNLPLFIARRYLVSKKKQHIINIISAISAGGIVVGTMALVIVLSVFNGFTVLIDTLFSSFDPDLKITPVHGKMFDPNTPDFDKIEHLPGVAHYAEIIEDVALMKFHNQIYPAIIKGVPTNYPQYTLIDSLIIDGKYILENEGRNCAVVGQGVAYNLGISPSLTEPMLVYVPRKGKQVSLNPVRAINHGIIYPAGVFAVLEDIDSKYVIVSQLFASDIFECGKQVTSVELGLSQPENATELQKKVQGILGDDFHVKTKYQQHDLIYKTMQSEKWAAYLILVFILVIASFNLLGSLSMLIIDKKDDIMILQSMGATSQLIGRIFLIEGWLISIVGAALGTILGILLCWLQITFEIISLPNNGSFLISAYPVKVVFTDILLVITVVVLIGFFAAWYPVKFISRKNITYNNL